MDLGNIFSRTVFLNLDRREDRRNQFEAMIDSIDWPFSPPVRISAVDAVQEKINCTEACRRSYVERILGPALAAGVDSILMMEDDALFSPDVRAMAERFFANVPDDWKSLFLGNAPQAPMKPVASGVAACDVPNRTHFWALRGEAIRCAYEWAKFGPRDSGIRADWISREHSGHIDHVVSRPLVGLGGCYCAMPTLAGQRGFYSDIAGNYRPTEWWAGPERVFVIVSIRNGPLDLLPHWIDHYAAWDTDGLIFVCYQVPGQPDASSEVERLMAERWAQQRSYVYVMRLPEKANAAMSEDHDWRIALHETGVIGLAAHGNDWLVATDLDEFIEFPGPVRRVAEAAAKQNIHAIRTDLIERVAADGSFPSINGAPILEQLSASAAITGRIGGGATSKVILSRCWLRLCEGHHSALRYDDHQKRWVWLDRYGYPIGSPADYHCWHAKYTAGSLERIRNYLSHPNAHPKWVEESKRVLEWIDANGGRINLADSRLA